MNGNNIDAQELNGVDGFFDFLQPNAVERDKYIKELNEVHQPMLDALKAEYEGKSNQLVAQVNADKANFEREKASLEAQITQRRKEKADREAVQTQKDKDDQAERDRIKNLPEKTLSKEVNTGTGGTGTVIKKDNTMLYVAVAGGVLVLTAIGVWVFVKNKKPAKTVNGTPRKRKK